MTFSDFKIDQTIIAKLEELSITEPTAVQAKSMPLIAAGKNIMFQSETGTGKTFAYLLPLLTRLMATENPKKNVRLMIASPTYELASQIKNQVQAVCGIKCALLIGGAPIARQIDMLREKPEVVIGGPARLLELIHLKKLKADAVETLVLDEADRLLSKELRDDTEGLLERLPRKVQLIGNSATVSDYTRTILQKARDGLNAGETEQDKIELVTLPMEDVLRKRITHWAIFAERRDKIDTLRSFINAVKPEKLLVFTSRNDQIDNITSKLQYKGIECASLSGKTDKRDRKAAIDRFRSGKIKVLITTDLTSRGLDIQDISHVIQMDLPEKEDFFIHRSGRTARAGKSGINCVIGDAFEMQNYARLEKKLKIKVYPKMLYKGQLVDPNDLAQEQ
ncbi:MAG: DEAD/DEAH box helicase [Treponema sp.]|nr:DEAD/DEAH box helicase [Candidatus Treponema equi]